MKAFTIDADNNITVHGSQATVDHVGWPYQPQGLTSAQMNLPFCVATLLAEGDVFVDQFSEAAVTDPRRMALAAKVTVAHRRDQLRAEKILQDRLFSNPKITVLWNTELAEVHGGDAPLKVKGVRLKDSRTGAHRELAVDGVFIAIGHTPASELFAGQIEMKPSGYIKTAPYSTATSVPGAFAAGDVTDDIYRQAVTAAGQGCMAALEAEHFLAAVEAEHGAHRKQRAEQPAALARFVWM